VTVEGAKESVAAPAGALGLRWFVFGPGGLRAGWRLLIFVAMIQLLFLVNNLIKRPLIGVADEVTMYVLGSLLGFLALLLASWIMSKIEGRRVGVYGLPWRRMLGLQFWQGILIGFAAMTLILAGMRALGVFHFGTIALRLPEVLTFAGLYALVLFVLALKEEYYYRGYALFTVATGIGFWPAAAISSAYFGLNHYLFAGVHWFGAINITLGGLFFCLLLRKTGNLWMALGCHVSLNWSQAFFYGVPDSGHAAPPGQFMHSTFSGSAWLTGGSVGPEGGLVSTLVFILFFIGFALWSRDAKYHPAAIHQGVSSET
jgi:uncharacterized protein